MYSIGFVGAGNMAGAIIQGVVRKGVLGAESIIVFDVDRNRTDYLRDTVGVAVAETISDLAQSTDTVIIAVKPGVVRSVLEEHVFDRKLVISIAAGVSTSSIQDVLGNDSRVVRIMPNTPALVGEGCSGLCATGTCSSEDRKFAFDIFSAVGLCVEMDEKLLNAVTALSGSGPAFCFMFMEALADGGVRSGLPRDTAMRFAAQTMLGSAKMVLETEKHPGVLKDMVSSPAGTTIEGLAALEDRAFRSAVISAVEAAYAKASSMEKSSS